MLVITGSTSCGRSSTVSTSSVNDNHTIQQENLDDGKVIFQKKSNVILSTDKSRLAMIVLF